MQWNNANFTLFVPASYMYVKGPELLNFFVPEDGQAPPTPDAVLTAKFKTTQLWYVSKFSWLSVLWNMFLNQAPLRKTVGDTSRSSMELK